MLALLVFGGPAAAVSAQARSAVAQDPALALAGRVAPADIMLPLEMKVGKQAFYMGFQADAESRALLEDYPDLPDVLWAAVEPEMTRSVAADHPSFLDKLAEVYRARLTTQEMAAAYEFFGSPTGRKLLVAGYQGMDPAPMLAEIAKGEGKLTAETARAVQQAGVRNAVRSLDQTDETALLRFAETVPLEKWKQVGAETQKLTLEWVNEEDPALDSRLEALIEAAVEKYMAEKGATD